MLCKLYLSILLFPFLLFAQFNQKVYVDDSKRIEFTSSNLPIFVINTNGQTIIDDEKITADLGVIYNGEGVRNYLTDPFNHYNGKIGIEIRGSSSQMFPKKQYGVETRDAGGNDLDVSLLGFPAESDWIFSAPYTDKSLMRDVLAYHLFSSMGHYASRYKYYELILNGEYRGVYVLFEKIKRDKNRVNIKKMEPTDISGDALTGGYIVKIDKWDGENNEGWNSSFPAYPGAWQNVSYQYHIPKPDDIVDQQKTYIKSFIYDFERKMNSDYFNNPDSGYATFIDVPSFVDMFLVNEVSKNVDGYRLSTFLYKDRNSVNKKIFAGPTWDYNLAFGNADYYEGWLRTDWQIDYLSSDPGFLSSDGYVPPFWWKKLMDDTTFANCVRYRWETLKNSLFSFNSFNTTIDSIVNVVNEAQVRNYQRWPILGTYVWPNAYIGQTYAEELIYLKSWIRDRLTWLSYYMIGNLTEVEETEIPNAFELSQNFPNPFNPSTTLSYSIPYQCNVIICIYNTLGQKVKELVNENKQAGKYSLTVDMSNYAGGVYFYRININSFNNGMNPVSLTKKMIYLK
ncbi:MAG: CotH kinase family protein [bacterium]